MPMTRSDMERVIRDGGSVLHDGRLYRTVTALPSEADLAKGDPDQEKTAAANLQAQITELRAQLDRLQAPAQPQAQTGAFASLSAEQTKALADAGYPDREAINAASDEDLQQVSGIGPATIAKLRAELQG